MLQEIVPAGAIVREVFGDDLDVALSPREAQIVARAVPNRQREFATARACAHSALRALGIVSEHIDKDHRGAPVWPSGVVGSITHCRGYRGAAVSLTQDVKAIGIDAEPNEPLPKSVVRLVANDQELAELPRYSGINWDKLLFSAKESIYKAWYPTMGTWLGFRDVFVSVNPDGDLVAQLISPGAAAGPPFFPIKGRWLLQNGILLTAVSFPVESDARAP